MFTKVINKTTVIAREDQIDYKYHKELDVLSAMRLARAIVIANRALDHKYWIAVNMSKVIMVELMKKNEVKEYKPTFKAFDHEKVRNFVSKGIGKFTSVRAYWRSHKGELVIVKGFYRGWKKFEGEEKDKMNLIDAMETYNAIILNDIHNLKYGFGVKLMSFSEIMAA